MDRKVVQRVIDAWNDAGPVPAYHDAIRAHLAQVWPTLHGAVQALAEGGGSEATIPVRGASQLEKVVSGLEDQGHHVVASYCPEGILVEAFVEELNLCIENEIKFDECGECHVRYVEEQSEDWARRR